MDKSSRRQLVRDYKERKAPIGVYAVRCAATGEAWVGVSKDLEQQPNRLWFALRMGGHPNKSMQAAYAAHGAEAFAIETLDVVDDRDLGVIGREARLKEREAHWRAELGAGKVVG
ncbi:MAG: GIY-YIG nuclease family protein [Proteobacteria bacterium]|nr:GIY-YIG nuclease family protein [Pseudomonadota bacterium]